MTSASGTTYTNLMGPQGDRGQKGDKGDPGTSVIHSWDGSVLTITSAAGTSSADLRGPKGDPGSGEGGSYDDSELRRLINGLKSEKVGYVEVFGNTIEMYDTPSKGRRIAAFNASVYDDGPLRRDIENTYAKKEDIPSVPSKLPNPNKITFTGAVAAEYDGSSPVTVNVPQGGSFDPEVLNEFIEVSDTQPTSEYTKVWVDTSDEEEVELVTKSDIPSIPTALPNPNALTFTGAATGSYDGSEPVTVNIPSGGGGGDWETVADIDMNEASEVLQELSGYRFLQ